VVADLRVTPKLFTPNGDGINESASVVFSLFLLFEARPVRVRVFSLDGREVRRLEQSLFGGRQSVQWDGRNEQGNLVPPGLYIVQVDAAADQQGLSGTKQSHLVGVAY
jgi:flagellar hook assembly protein FlgD